MSINAEKLAVMGVFDAVHYGFGVVLVSDGALENIKLLSLLKNEGDSGITSQDSIETGAN